MNKEKQIPDYAESFDQDTYTKEAEIRFDPTVVAESKRKVAKMTKERLEEIKRETEIICQELASLMPMSVESPQIQALIRRHHQNLENFYHVTQDIYRGLGELYIIDPSFTAFYEKYKAGLADYLSQAMNHYCNTEFKEIQQHR